MSSQKKINEEDDDESELRKAVNIFDKLPVGVLLIMMTDTPSVFVHPDRLEKLFRAAGYERLANETFKNMGRPGFWKLLVKQCFPRVNALPAFIEARLRSGKVYRDNSPEDYELELLPLPASEPMRAVDQAWRSTMQYILSILKDVRVTIDVGGQFDSFGTWEPPLRIDKDSITTCDDYTLSPHIVTHEHDADVDTQAPFLFNIDFTPTFNEGATYIESKIAVGFFDQLDLPVAADLGKDAESENSTIGEMARGANGGALVFTGRGSAPFPFNDMIEFDYELRWTTNVIRNRFRYVIPHVRTRVITHLKLWPGHIGDHTLHAIYLRKEARKFPPERLPLTVEVYDGNFAPPRKVGVSLTLIVRDSTYVFPIPVTGNSLVHRIIESIKSESLANSMYDGNYTIEIPYEWNKDWSSESITLTEGLTPVGNLPDTHIGEIIGPPRPYRPILSTEPHYKWFTGGERGPKNIVIKVITPAKL